MTPSTTPETPDMQKPDPISTAELPVYSFRDPEDGTDFAFPKVDVGASYQSPHGKISVGFSEAMGALFIRFHNVEGGTVYLRGDDIAIAGANISMQDPNKEKVTE